MATAFLIVVLLVVLVLFVTTIGPVDQADTLSRKYRGRPVRWSDLFRND